jgi:hypothetical protein
MMPRFGWPLIPLERHRCTMAAASALGSPARLGMAADALELANRKDVAGERLMLQMSKPRRARQGENGRRRPYSDLPKSVDKLIDDPFRSLAGELRRAGGFAKDTTPFSEFLWADFLRRRMKRGAVETDFALAIEKSLQLAKSVDANYLPGWCGPVPEE